MSSFEESRVRELLAADSYSVALGVQLVSVTSDEIVVALDVAGRHTNFVGLGHGGMVFSLADCALALASNCEGQTALAIDAHLSLTAPTRPGDRLTAKIAEVSRGKKLGTYRVDVTRGDSRLVAAFTGTVHIATE